MKNQFVLFVILTSLVTGLAYLLFSINPKATPIAQMPKIEYEFIDADVEDDLDFQVKAKKAMVENPSVPQKVEVVTPVVEAIEEKPAKSHELLRFNMGEYDITLKGGAWKIKLTPVITTYDTVTFQALRSSIENLRRILFFLGSHRVIEGLQAEGGVERFESDYLERVKNVIRVGEIHGLSFTLVNIYENPHPPAQGSEVDEIPIRRGGIVEEEMGKGGEQVPKVVPVYDPAVPTHSGDGVKPSVFKPNANGVDPGYQPGAE